MNKAVIVGRLTKDVELKTTASGVSVCSFTIAVNRRFKNAEGNYEADFINCVAWRNQAEFLSKYFEKGSMVGIAGSIQTRNYEKDGNKVYITEILVDEADFPIQDKAESKAEPAEVTPYDAPSQFAGFEAVAADDSLPF